MGRKLRSMIIFECYRNNERKQFDFDFYKNKKQSHSLFQYSVLLSGSFYTIFKNGCNHFRQSLPAKGIVKIAPVANLCLSSPNHFLIGILMKWLLIFLTGCSGWKLETGSPNSAGSKNYTTYNECTKDAQCASGVCMKNKGYVGLCK